MLKSSNQFVLLQEGGGTIIFTGANIDLCIR